MSDANRGAAGVKLISNICVPMTRDHIGVLAAVTSSAIGGVAGGATRFVIHATDPVTLGVLRFGTGFLILLAIALILKSQNCNCGLVQHSIGSTISARYGGSKSSPLSPQAARLTTNLECPLLAQSRHGRVHCKSPLSGVKRTYHSRF